MVESSVGGVADVGVACHAKGLAKGVRGDWMGVVVCVSDCKEAGLALVVEEKLDSLLDGLAEFRRAAGHLAVGEEGKNGKARHCNLVLGPRTIFVLDGLQPAQGTYDGGFGPFVAPKLQQT